MVSHVGSNASLQRSDDSAARYSITVAVRLQSEPDEGALRESARALVARHDALRTVFQFKDGLACQTVRPDAEYEFSRYDFGHMSLLEQKRGLSEGPERRVHPSFQSSERAAVPHGAHQAGRPAGASF